MQSRPFALSLALFAGLTASSAFAQDSMTPEARDAFRAEVRAYLLEHPEVLVEAMDVLQARQEAAAAEKEKTIVADNHEAIFNDGTSWVGGNPEGDVTVVEFLDYRCGYCRKAWQEVDELVQTDGNIRFVMKEFPILGEQSVISSRFAIAVQQLHGPEAYATTHDALISLRADATPESLERLAGDLGYDWEELKAKMDAPEVTAVIEANHALAQKLEITGTPTFVVDGTMVRGYVPLDGMRQIIASERAKSEG
ncbi:DsbA family protein [Paragemmobacter straminiformis]|uniref:DsbA family protein n=1 Tax=Paragemmobacter straminiformis TaxID=2045119 RepID=A0A842I9H3_9RHOB|nr:DsbA family protein [Gemmobacter straminiformis]MBC2835638.1 DsbA family protein [Gemmobacter straminiformis]